MFAQFRSEYRRVEESLQRLTDSIAAYNPSVSAADELVAADEAVERSLEKLVTHQTNHMRIQELRQTAESLDQNLRNTIQLLAETRKDILAIPSSTTPDEPRREVKVDELLSYAKFISKTTVPPTFRKQDLAPLPSKQIAAESAPMTNGTSTPLPALDDLLKESTSTKAPDEASQSFLNPLQNTPFEPWPSIGVIQSGALANIQRMVENGQDPGSVLTTEEQEKADARRVEDEERARVRMEEEERRRMNRWEVGAGGRRGAEREVAFDPDDL